MSGTLPTQQTPVPVKLQKHDGGYSVIAVPKLAVSEQVLRAEEVVLTVGAPGATPFAVEARKWVERRKMVYFITRKPYSDYLSELARQGVRTLLLYSIAPKP